MKPFALYRMYSCDGTLLYVGMSVNVGVRIYTHSNGSVWFGMVDHIKIERFKSKGECKAAEEVAILEENPLHNSVIAVPIKERKRRKRIPIEPESGMVDLLINVDGEEKPARGHLRGDMVMVPSPHGPLYFKKPKWKIAREAADA